MTNPATTVRFIGTERLCPTTATFSFTRPEGYAFRAGEFMRLSLMTREGMQSHSLSHADAPGDEAAMVLTRLTGSPFKDALLALRPGDEVTLEGPFGALSLGPEVTRTVFLVGGVGVSPARSIVRDVAREGRPVEILLFDGNVDESCIPFLDEFAGYAKAHDNLRFVHCLSSPSDSWVGERGFITAPMVGRYCDSPGDRDWYICGPPAMVDAMRKVVDELAIPKSRLHFESFTGYA